ncbi:hypothetical protein GCM10022214_24860 [Actinomadura miaoliensis]|uniref:Uncharacterized protein n=1 Tax=Actinomadura miaoliensis TaxID=430685 RepID=A0ABP7VKD9_9ACTN
MHLRVLRGVSQHAESWATGRDNSGGGPVTWAESCAWWYASFAAAAGPETAGRRPAAEQGAGRKPVVHSSDEPPRGIAIMNTDVNVPTPADDAAEEAARALQTALDRRDNGGRSDR